MSHRFSNSKVTRETIKLLAGEPAFKLWADVPLMTRLLIMIHIQDCIEEVLSEN